MATTTVRVEGLTELYRALGKGEKQLRRDMQKTLRAFAEPVAADVRALAQREGFGPRTVSGIRAGSSRGIPVVRQARRKTANPRPGFGGLQMRRAFLPGLERNEPRIVRGIDRLVDDVANVIERG